MSESQSKSIVISEICRVEGHSAVEVLIEDSKLKSVKLEVFEGTRFFEKIVLGHNFSEIPHISSRVCAICSTGHVLSAIKVFESIFEFGPSGQEFLCRELMHLGMIIESHATHICALALPDFLESPDIVDLATKHPGEFALWVKLRETGAAIQKLIGGRPFHPVNLHVGGLSSYPNKEALSALLAQVKDSAESAQDLCRLLLDLRFSFGNTCQTSYLALIPDSDHYGYFGDEVLSTEGVRFPVAEYRQVFKETASAYSHAKRCTLDSKPFMVGAMARLFLFGDRLKAEALSIYKQSPLAKGETHTVLNNLAQAIEIVEAIERSCTIIEELILLASVDTIAKSPSSLKIQAGEGAAAVECPRGTLYHYYKVDETGKVEAADLVTPSVQNTARIEYDISSVAEAYIEGPTTESLQGYLETLIRAYDPCNTCATHMVSVRRYDSSKNEGD